MRSTVESVIAVPLIVIDDGDDHGSYIGSRTDILDVTVDDVVDEARSWRIRPGTALDIVTGLVGLTSRAIEQATQTLNLGAPDALVQRIADRTTGFL
jgi:hypothetical protein